MKRIIILLFLVIVSACYTMSLFAQGYEPMINIDRSVSNEGTRYIAVDKNRIVNNVSRGQLVGSSNQSQYNIEVDSYTMPTHQELLALETRDNIKFGKGMGVDMDIIREVDATGIGSMDARQIDNIRQDLIRQWYKMVRNKNKMGQNDLFKSHSDLFLLSIYEYDIFSKI